METLSALKKQSIQRVEKASKFITDILEKLDELIRTVDHSRNYSYGEKIPLLLKPAGHYYMISWNLVFLLTFLVLGPNLDSVHGAALIVLCLSYVAAIVIPLQLAKPHTLFWYQFSLVTLLSLAIWFFLSQDHIEREGKLYQHILIPILWLMLGGILIARVAAPWLLRRFNASFSTYLKQVEVFYSTTDHPMRVSWRAYLRSFLTTPFYNPIRLLLFPSITVLLLPDRHVMWFGVVSGGLLAWLYLAAASVHERLNYLMEVVNGVFFRGGQLVISIFVIAIAVARICGEPHVTILIESSPGKVNMTIIRYVLAAYVLFWFFEYWINRALLDQFVLLFDPAPTRDSPGKVNFNADTSHTSVAPEGRCLQAHGGSRLIVLGTQMQTGLPCWHFYSRSELLDAIFSQVDKDQKAIYNDYQTAQVIKQRMQVFFLLLNLYLVLSISAMIIYYAGLPQKAETSSASITHEEQRNLFDLHERLFLQPDSQKDQPLILIAASGGGTRAALYTESLLRGLREYDLLDNAVLTSSVSGGSAAMAYFSAYSDSLLQEAVGTDNGRWQTFSDTMAKPFIQDVLEGAADWRLFGGIKQSTADGRTYQAGFRMGELLAESFEHHFEFSEAPQQHRNRVGHQQAFGTIFNTAVVAKYPRWDCRTVAKNEKWKDCVCESTIPLALREQTCPELLTSIGQGGRLIFTNLADGDAFPRNGHPMTEDIHLHYEIVQDPKVPLTRAAALSANFPPVFPNAVVDVENARRYRITDGGATDNRGVLSLLYALRNAVRKEKIRCEATDCNDTPRPALHIFVAEASATTLSFTRSSGLSASFGAPEQFASQLMVDMAKEIKDTYESLKGTQKGTVYFHYLAMPFIMRSNGGLSTHWMLPSNVTFNQPLDMGLAGKYKDVDAIQLEGEAARALVDALHSRHYSMPANQDMRTLWQWICGDQFSAHQQRWQKALKDLGMTDIPNRCAAQLPDDQAIAM